LPDTPTENATLGPVIETYRGSRWALGVAVPAVLGIVAAEYSRHGISLGTLGILALVAFVACLVLRARVTLHEEGLRWRSILGTEEILWGDVARLYFSVSRLNALLSRGNFRLRLEGRDGRRIRIDNQVGRAWVLGKRIAERTTPLLLPGVLRRFGSGAEVGFGPIRVSQGDGLRLDRNFDPLHIPWADFAGYRLGRSFLFLQATGKLTRRVALRSIPNAFVLLALLDHLHPTSV
jgi:hypothetical protein